MKLKKQVSITMLSLILISMVGLILYLTIQTKGNVSFALFIRIPKVVAFFIVSICISFSTITFQTLTENRLLTPSIIGIDSLYVLMQTVFIFFFSSQFILNSNQLLNFLVSTAFVIFLSISLYYRFLKKYPQKISFLLLFGIIFGTLTNSLNQFLQVIMDPNEFNIVLSRTLTSFNQMNTDAVGIALLISVPCVGYLFLKNKELDVIHLGWDYANNLGIEVDKEYLKLFVIILILTATSTSLVGPVSFLGFLGANVAYRLFPTYKHSVLFVGATLITFVFVVVGQTIVEHVFLTQTTLGVIIDFIGGIYFIYLLLKEGI